MAKRNNSRGAILDAAEDTVVEIGAIHMTLEAVSARAGISKGGLLYHFPSKNDLLKGMIERLVEQTKAERESESARLAPGPDRQIKAHVHSRTRQDSRREQIGAAALAAAAHDPKLLGPVSIAFRELMNDFTAEGVTMERAAVIFLAAEGLFLMEMLGVVDFSPKERQAIVKEMLDLAEN